MGFFSDPEKMLAETQVVDRFIRYVKIDTTSDEKSPTCPSTECQWELAHLLVEELKELGLKDAAVDENCYVTASFAANVKTDAKVGLIAHLDTAPAYSGTNVNPILHENYDGKRIELKNNVVIDPETDPMLLDYKGGTIITADGTTLLAADDKAGIAAIMAALEYYKKNPDVPHPTVKVGFTPDEEIGRGAAKFPIKEFDAEVAFTMDGSHPGEINVETFNADSAFVTVTGVSTHPGKAKGKLVNAMRYMGRFLAALPPEVSPECTEDREGFIHPCDMQGDSTECKCHLILRDFDEPRLKALGETVKSIIAQLKKEETRLQVDLEIKRSYPNMFQFLKDKPEIADRLKEAVEKTGLTPEIVPVRGGTDGANLTRKGLPCPNVFTGGMNFHGPTEWISTRGMGLGICTILNLMQLYAV